MRCPAGQHAVDRNRQLAAAALGSPAPADCDYGLRAEGPLPVALPSPYAVLLTMTSRADKLWPEASWIELGRLLAVRGVRAVLPWGSEEERLRAARIAAGVGDALVPRRMSVAEIARLLRGARGVAGVDTGLTHLAAALGVPAVGIYLRLRGARLPACTPAHACAISTRRTQRRCTPRSRSLA